MKDYNGYSGAQRAKAQKWLNAEWKAGRLARPAVCSACGQDQGIIDAHAEDYSEPFAAGKTDEFHLCRVCHTQVHRRFRYPAVWVAYRAAVAKGGRKIISGFAWYTKPMRRPLDEIDARENPPTP